MSQDCFTLPCDVVTVSGPRPPMFAAMLQTIANPAYTVDRDSSISKPLATASETGSSDAGPGCTNCGCDRDLSPETASLAPGAAAVAAGASGIRRMTWQAWLSPIFVWAGICVHAILEGLALGLQRDKAGTVAVLVAMVSHKWVESVALSSILVKKGGGFKWVVSLCTLVCFVLHRPSTHGCLLKHSVHLTLTAVDK